jgi:hypothetical protein
MTMNTWGTFGELDGVRVGIKSWKSLGTMRCDDSGASGVRYVLRMRDESN